MLPTLDVAIHKRPDYWAPPALYEGALPGEEVTGATAASGAQAGAAIATGQGRSLLLLAILAGWLATKG